MECLKKIKEVRPDVRVVLFTGYGTISTAVEAMKFGAANYLTKPVSIDQVVDALLDVVDEEDEPSCRTKKMIALVLLEEKRIY